MAAVTLWASVEGADMTKLQLGPVGVVVGKPGDEDVFLAAAPELAELGYSTIWLAGPQIQRLDQIGNLVRATRDIQVASGILSLTGSTPRPWSPPMPSSTPAIPAASSSALAAPNGPRHPGA